MDRQFKFLGELTDDGFLQHDRDEVRVALMDLEAAVFQLGGIVTMTAIRQEVAPGDFQTTGVLMHFSSFSPARTLSADDAAEIESSG